MVFGFYQFGKFSVFPCDFVVFRPPLYSFLGNLFEMLCGTDHVFSRALAIKLDSLDVLVLLPICYQFLQHKGDTFFTSPNVSQF